MTTIIKNTYGMSTQRIEIELSNGQSLTLMVNQDTGKVSVLSDNPHVIGFQLNNEKGLPVNVVPVNYYGYPTE